MTRAEFVAKYREQYEQSPEKSLAWLTARDVYGMANGPAPASWVIEQLQKIQARFEEAAERAGYMADSVYGTYGSFTVHRCHALDEAIAELNCIEEG
jgi:hypothetical protein